MPRDPDAPRGPGAEPGGDANAGAADGAADLARRKHALRRRIRSARDAMPADARSVASGRIRERVLAEIERRGDGPTVMAFWSFGSEVETPPLVDELVASGARVALPRIVGREIEARAFRPGDPLSDTAFGAREPAAGPLVPPRQLDVVLVPGLVFDRLGFRLGYGAGFYDRFLAATRVDAARIGLCFALQVVPRVPAGPSDLPVDLVVTEREAIGPIDRTGAT
jgi:5-formyltetrahydrofolate cyclo-ligase